MAGPYLWLRGGLGIAVRAAQEATVGWPWSPLVPRNSPVDGRDTSPIGRVSGSGLSRAWVVFEPPPPPLAQLALHNPHIWANSLKPVCFLCFLLFWCPLLPFIETGTLKIYTKMVLYMKNEFLTSNTPSMGFEPTLYQP